MRRKELESIHRLLSRRRALQGVGAMLAGTAGCADGDPSTTGDEGSSSVSGTTIDPSSVSTSLGWDAVHLMWNLGKMDGFVIQHELVLAQGPQWGRCLSIITYDERSGFYDHVLPLETVDENPAFTRLGMRVPSLAIGPHVRRGCVGNTVLEHVSVISTLTTRFSLPPMNARVVATNDLSSCIDPAYLDDPQPAISLPKIQARLSELLAMRGNDDAHFEMRAMIARGEIRCPPIAVTPRPAATSRWS